MVSIAILPMSFANSGYGKGCEEHDRFCTLLRMRARAGAPREKPAPMLYRVFYLLFAVHGRN